MNYKFLKNVKSKASVNHKIHWIIKTKVWLKAGFFIFLNFISLQGNSQTDINISLELEKKGFENIRAVRYDNTYYIALENMTYRWDPLAVAEVLDWLSINVDDSSLIKIVLIKNAIPQIIIAVNSYAWQKYRNAELNTYQFSGELSVSHDIDEAWNILKKIIPVNSNTGKIDVVVHPQFSYENTRLAKIYETQFNIAPSLEFSLWKGNKFTGQVIFPIHNELGYEGAFIRPGFVTLTQDYRLPKNWLGKFSAGNFSNSRYGFEMFLWHPFQNDNWNVELKGGLTGFSHFFENKWSHGKLNTFTWYSSISWYFSRFNMVLKGGAAQYIYNDRGLFATCTRYFGETSVGFFALLNQHNLNGGFIINVPFPIQKRGKRKLLRLTVPKQFGIDYNAGTELYYNQNFRSNIDHNQIKIINFTQMFKNEILNLNK